jgi:D-alanyl-D-alanine dipeptidase
MLKRAALCIALLSALSMCASGHAVAAHALPDGFVYLRDIEPSIVQDMQYASARNFTGRPVPGYDASECVLKREAAEALKRAQEKARASGLSLEVYDCYRPERAVRAFLAWAASAEDGLTKSYYPHLPKSQLVPQYIAPQSTHSTGLAVDITLIPSAAPPGDDSSAARKDCTETGHENPADNSLDMGTAFDCFDPKANTSSSLANAEQHKARAILIRILEQVGFNNYSAEWWHFTFSGTKDHRRFDFPIEPR